MMSVSTPSSTTPAGDAAARLLTVTIDGQEVQVAPGTTIWEAARQAGIDIPVLCHSPPLRPVGVCRMCVVDVGERVLAASCVRECREGQAVETASPKVEKHRKMLTRLLLSETPLPGRREETTGDDLLLELGRKYGLLNADNTPAEPVNDGSPEARVFPPGLSPGGGIPQNGNASSTSAPAPTASAAAPGCTLRPEDPSSPVIAVDHQACILCDRCIRACDEIQNNDVIGRTGKGATARIAFDLDQPMGESTCVSCGECAAVCPTGALTGKAITLPIIPREQLEQVDTVCPYCGVGCAITAHKQDETIVFVEGRESHVNHSRLCVKGRYGWDYSSHPQRLTRPLIRREEFYPKGPLSAAVKDSLGDPVAGKNGRRRKAGGMVDYSEIMPAFREATWDEALDLVASRLNGLKEQHGPGSLAGFGSAKCTNEEAYLFQKLMRAGLGTNNVDHCTRLCHASSVAALMETIGSGAVTNVFADVARSGVALLTGSNAAANHPVAATFMKEAIRNGTKLIIVDVRRHELARFATHFAQIRPGTDVAFYNSVMHVLLREGLIDEHYIAEHTEGFDDLRELVLSDVCSPEQASAVCGVEPELIRAIACTIGETTRPDERGMLVFWGMGISQHTHGTDNARCLISLCLLTGNVGKPGTGLHPLRGQNNVQGASDAGLIPIAYPDYQLVESTEIRQKFEAAWGRELDPNLGLSVVEIMNGALTGQVRGMYILGENPFLSDPNANKVRKALGSLEFLAVQDIFLTETAEFADVIFPASTFFEKSGTVTNTDRRVQLGRQVLPPPGEARPDWEIICDLSRRLGLPMDYASPAEVFDEFASLTDSYHGMSHQQLGRTGRLWPAGDASEPDGKQILFGDRFPTANGRGKFVPCPFQPASELPDPAYPFVLSTGRLLEHWHTGSMTRRSQALHSIEPVACASLHPSDLAALNLAHGDRIRVESRRGKIELEARADSGIDPGTVFIPFHFREASANILTTDALDPFGKIPEFKFCAVKVSGVE